MAITNKLNKIVNLKIWETIGINPYGNMGAGAFITGDTVNEYMPGGDNIFVVLSSTSVQRYSAAENALVAITNPALGGSFGPGTCGETMVYGAPNGVLLQSATAGTTKDCSFMYNAFTQSWAKLIVIVEPEIVMAPLDVDKSTIAVGAYQVEATDSAGKKQVLLDGSFTVLKDLV